VPRDEDFNAILIRIPPGSPEGQFEILGFITNGSITFTQASSTGGAPVVGTPVSGLILPSGS
jgi:hypothetical protein